VVNWPWSSPRKPLEAKSGKGLNSPRLREDKGTTTTSISYTDKLPHPQNMSRYDALCNDPETSVGINILADMVAGVGMYTEMPEGSDEDHENKQTIDEYAERVNLDERMVQVERTKLGKGFSPVEILVDYSLKLLPPETFYIWRTPLGKTYRYTQEISGSEVARWNLSGWKESISQAKVCYKEYKEEVYETIITEELVEETLSTSKIVLFINREDTSHPYGKALVEPLVELIEARIQMNQDMPAAIHKYAYPGLVWKTKGPKDQLQSAVEDRGPDEDIFIGNVNPDEVEWGEIGINPQARFIPYIELVYYQICEGLHAPLLMYLKNATEASANVMLESVDRYVQSLQRYDKRRVEKYLFEPQVGKPVPRLMWGAPKTVFDEITLTDVAQLYSSRAITFDQVQDIIKQKGIPLVDVKPGDEPQPELPLLDPSRMSHLEASLKVVQETFENGKITITEAMREGDRAISVHVEKAKYMAMKKLSESMDKPVVSLSPESEHYFTLIRNELFANFRNTLLPTNIEGELTYKKSYTVIPNR